jgi:hypothetical protein
MYQQPNQMAADPTTQRQPTLMVQPGQPPFLPQISHLPGELQPYYPLIVSLLVIELQNKMGQNAARMHAFNMMAMNNYQTTEFVNLVELYVKYLDAWMRVGPGSRQAIPTDQAITATLPDYVGAYCLATVSEPQFQYIYNYLDQNTAQYVNQAAQSMQEILRLIQMAQGTGMYQTGMQQIHNGQMQGHFPSHAGQMPRTVQTINSRVLHSGPTGSAATGAAGLFSNSSAADQGQLRQPQQTLGSHGPSRYALQLQRMLDEQAAKQSGGFQAQHHAQQHQPVAAPATGAVSFRANMPKTAQAMAQPTPTATQAIKAMEVPKTDAAPPAPTPSPSPNKLQWKPSKAQPYRVLFDFTKFKEELRVVDGDVISITMPLKPEELSTMNIEDHALTRQPNPRYDAVGLDGNSVEVPTDAIPVVPKFELEIFDDKMLELSTSIANVITGLRYRISKHNVPKSAAKCYQAVIVDLVTVDDSEKIKQYQALISRLAACNTFQEGVAVLDEIADNPADRLFFTKLDRLLADEISLILSMNIPGFRIDSFYTDVMEIIPAIAKKRGEAVAQSFAANQRRFFHQLMAEYDEKQLSENTDFMLKEYVYNSEENPDGWQAGIAMVAWETSFTHLMIPSWELNISLAPGQAGVLTEKTTPELYSLADQLLNMTDGDSYRRHYLITSDGLQLMVARGYLNDQAYLVRRVREVA